MSSPSARPVAADPARGRGPRGCNPTRQMTQRAGRPGDAVRCTLSRHGLVQRRPGRVTQRLASAWVTPEPGRCVQCGMCSFNCPMGIDVRRHVWHEEPAGDGLCLACGECVKRCPRGLLRFEPIGPARAPSGDGAALTWPRAVRPHRRRAGRASPRPRSSGAQTPAPRSSWSAADPYGFYSRPGLAYYLTGELPRRRLFPFTVEEIRRARPDLRPRARHPASIPRPGSSRSQSGRRLQYDRLLLATGAAAIMPGIPGSGPRRRGQAGRHGRRRGHRAQGARRASGRGGRRRHHRARDRGGPQGARRCTCTTSCAKSATGATSSPSSESRIVEQALAREGVDLHPFTELAGVVGRDGRVTGVETGDGTRIRCQTGRDRRGRAPARGAGVGGRAGLRPRGAGRRAPADERPPHLRSRRRCRSARRAHRPSHPGRPLERGPRQGPGSRGRTWPAASPGR